MRRWSRRRENNKIVEEEEGIKKNWGGKRSVKNIDCPFWSTFWSWVRVWDRMRVLTRGIACGGLSCDQESRTIRILRVKVRAIG